MIVRRVHEEVVKKFRVGDEISVGKYTATAVKRVDDNTMLFCLDQYLDNLFTHKDLLNKLNEYLQTDPNFEDILSKIAEIDGVKFRVPYVGEMFGDDDFYESDTYDENWHDQWICMKDRRNRIADRKGVVVECDWGWLMNCVKGYETYFAAVNTNGNVRAHLDSALDDVRPVFALKERRE